MFGLQLGRLGISGSLFSESALWPQGASSPGLWIDGPSYSSSCYQDSAGTTALSTVGTVLDSSNPVGLVLDRKGGATSKTDPGIHLSQSTSAARPVASARKNLLVGTATLSTQSVTVTAIPHTITFSGGGTVTASGTYSGALTSGQTFTPTAGTLTLTVSGTVTSAQLERGSAATTYQAVVSASDYTATGPAYLKFDGTDDALSSATFSAGTFTSSMDCLIAVRRDSSANTMLLVGGASKYLGWIEAGYGSLALTGCGSAGTLWVNGVQVAGGTTTTAGQLHLAVPVGSWSIVEARNVDLSAWTAVIAASASGVHPGYTLNGALGKILLFASGQDSNRDKARQRMAAYFGVTLP